MKTNGSNWSRGIVSSEYFHDRSAEERRVTSNLVKGQVLVGVPDGQVAMGEALLADMENSWSMYTRHLCDQDELVDPLGELFKNGCGLGRGLSQRQIKWAKPVLPED